MRTRTCGIHCNRKEIWPTWTTSHKPGMEVSPPKRNPDDLSFDELNDLEEETLDEEDEEADEKKKRTTSRGGAGRRRGPRGRGRGPMRTTKTKTLEDEDEEKSRADPPVRGRRPQSPGLW